MEVADNFLESEEDGSERGVKSRGNRSGGADGDQRFHPFGAQAKRSSKNGGNSRAHLHSGSFTTEGDTAGQGHRSAEELAKDSTQGDAALVSVKGSFGLWNTAAAGIREEAPEQIAHAERTDDWDDKTTPGRAAGGIEARTKALGDQDEGDDDEANKRADEKSEDEEDLFLAVLNEGGPATPWCFPTGTNLRVFLHGLARAPWNQYIVLRYEFASMAKRLWKCPYEWSRTILRSAAMRGITP